MAKANASIPQGTRDFGPDVVRKRNYIFNTIQSVFELYGFEPLETPAMERPPIPIAIGTKGGLYEPLNVKSFLNGKD